MNYPMLSSLSLVLLALTVSPTTARYPFAQVAQRYEQQEPIEQQSTYDSGSGTPSAYRFSYNTGSGSAADASHFREESRDESGVVVGKYGYVDPYGKLRVVSYTAGPQGFVASGDTGPDQETLRQQRELYANDQSYQIQQQVWQQLATGQQPSVASQQYYSAGTNTGSSSSNSAASSAASSSSSSSSDWTAVNNDATVVGSAGDYTATKGGALKSSQFAERYTAARKSPVAAYREQTTTVQHVQQVPVATKSVKTVKSSTVSGSSSSASASAAAAASSSAYTAPATSQTVYSQSTKSVQQPVVHQTAAVKQYSYYQTAPVKTVQSVKTVQPARLVQSTKSTKSVQQQQYTSGYQSPAARLVAINNGASSSAASASAASSASSSAFSGAYSNAGGVKGYSGAIKSPPVKVARYTNSAPAGRGFTQVNFSQGGPSPFQYSYSY